VALSPQIDVKKEREKAALRVGESLLGGCAVFGGAPVLAIQLDRRGPSVLDCAELFANRRR
jgi:hypothetical protein